MNSGTKTALVMCLAVSIFAVFVPWFSQAHAAFTIELVFRGHGTMIRGQFTCDGSINDAKLDFYSADHANINDPIGNPKRPLSAGDTGWILIVVPKEQRAFNNFGFVGRVTDVQITLGQNRHTGDSFKISAVIDQDFCNRKKTFVELSSVEELDFDRKFFCDGKSDYIDIQYRGKGIGATDFSDNGVFHGEITCKGGSPREYPKKFTNPSGDGEVIGYENPFGRTTIGTPANNLIEGKEGNDILRGLDGNDKLVGGEGRDLLVGGDGNDELIGGPGPDTFSCGSGTDKIIDFKPSEGDRKTNDCEQF